MTQHFTKDDLIRFIYKETTASETISISETLCKDTKLFYEYEEMLAAFQHLPKVKFSPSSAVVQKIIDYSEQTALADC